MPSQSSKGTIIGAIQIVVGVILTAVGLGAVGIPMIISGVMTIAGTALAPRPQGGIGGFETSSTYGFDGMSNSAFEGSPIQIPLGEHKMAPSYINAMTEMDEQDQYMKAMLLVGSGGAYGIQGIENIKLNDQPIGHYPDVKVQIRLGAPGEVKPRGFEKVSIPYQKNFQLEYDADWVTFESYDKIDEMAFIFVLPRGLIHNTRKGSQKNATQAVRIESSEDDGRTWKIKGPDDGTDDWDITRTATQPIRFVCPVKFRKRKIRKFRVKMLYDNTKTHTTRDVTLLRVEERVYDNRNYSGFAYIALEALASADLSGGLPKITCDVKGWKVVKVGLAERHAAWSRNPIALLRAMMTNVQDGLGRWISPLVATGSNDIMSSPDLDDFNFENNSWLAAQTYCDEKVKPYGKRTETRHELNLIIDSIQSGTDWIDHILKICRCSIIEYNDKLHIVIDNAGSSVRTFDGRQFPDEGTSPILAGEDGTASVRETSVDATETYTHVRCQYYNKENDYFRQWTNTMIAADWDSDTDLKVEVELDLPGVTKGTQASRQARYTLNKSVASGKVYEWAVGLGDLDLLPGDIVTLYADAPPIDGQEVRIIGGTFSPDGVGGYVGLRYDSSVYDDNNIADRQVEEPLTSYAGSAVKSRGRVPSSGYNLRGRTVN